MELFSLFSHSSNLISPYPSSTHHRCYFVLNYQFIHYFSFAYLLWLGKISAFKSCGWRWALYTHCLYCRSYNSSMRPKACPMSLGTLSAVAEFCGSKLCKVIGLPEGQRPSINHTLLRDSIPQTAMPIPDVQTRGD